ncbi:uncharacterized protein LOC62_03G003616 [Vanrija pseudolonga]|uniref:Uncharacterized protein n=1 Tax=Vanrija pseudolonga TaxID=143232 RepID=A0AAF0Y4Q8_9TREE|nr:hypothetical protein LOC62_03G003616 [Vanrija pseudolonga]
MNAGPSVGRFPNAHPDSPLRPAYAADYIAHLRRMIDLHDLGRLDIMDYDEGDHLCSLLESLDISPDVLKAGEEARRGDARRAYLKAQYKAHAYPGKHMAEEDAGDPEDSEEELGFDMIEERILARHIARYSELQEKKRAAARARAEDGFINKSAAANHTAAEVPPPTPARRKNFFKRLLDKLK